MNSEKEQKEYEILLKVFKENSGCKVEKSEQPDFVVSYSNGSSADISVGVEITELYYNQSSARLKNRPGYIANVINGVAVHREDRDQMDVREVTYLPGGLQSKAFKTKMLFLKNYTIEDYRSAFLHALKKKKISREKYKEGLSQTGLIIYDKEGQFKKIEKEKFIGNFFSDKIVEEIKSSPFEEIYLVTSFAGSENEVYVRLKHCVLQNEKAIFFNYLKDNLLLPILQKNKINVGDVFAELLIKRGYKNVKKGRRNGVDVITCVRYCFHFDEIKCVCGVYDDFPMLYHHFDEDANIQKDFFTEKSFNRFVRYSRGKFSVFDVAFESFESFGSRAVHLNA